MREIKEERGRETFIPQSLETFYLEVKSLTYLDL
jgi:hypothetical protein